MSDTVIITLIIAAAVLIALYIFRRQLKDFIFHINKDTGIQTEIHTHAPQPPFPTSESAQPTPLSPQSSALNPSSSGVTISGNVQRGKNHSITAERPATITDNRQTGQGHVIAAAAPHITHLHQQINLLTLNDFRTLCLNLGVDPAALPAADQTAALLAQLQAQNRLPALTAAARTLRPDLDWEA